MVRPRMSLSPRLLPPQVEGGASLRRCVGGESRGTTPPPFWFFPFSCDLFYLTMCASQPISTVHGGGGEATPACFCSAAVSRCRLYVPWFEPKDRSHRLASTSPRLFCRCSIGVDSSGRDQRRALYTRPAAFALAAPSSTLGDGRVVCVRLPPPCDASIPGAGGIDSSRQQQGRARAPLRFTSLLSDTTPHPTPNTQTSRNHSAPRRPCAAPSAPSPSQPSRSRPPPRSPPVAPSARAPTVCVVCVYVLRGASDQSEN